MDTLRRGCNTIFTIWSIQNPSLIGWRQPVLPKFHSAELTAALLAEGYGDQVLISMDYSAMTGFDEEGRLKADLYEVPGRTYLYMFTHVLDMLRRFGVGEEAIEHLLRDNPRRMLLRG
jgi:predicted metal-dependent phosphotriesterase family hydrolase